MGRRLVNLNRALDAATGPILEAADLAETAASILALVASGVTTAQSLAQVLCISKQAVAKHVACLVRLRLLAKDTDVPVGQSQALSLTDRALAAELEQGLASLAARWRKAVGGAALDELHTHMAAMADSPALAAYPLAVHLVHQTQVFGQRTAAYISEHGYPGMTFAQILVIGSVPADGAVETTTMVRQRLISRQAMHVHLDHLVAAGLLTKSVSTQDARRTYVAFTARGRRMLDTAIDAIDHEERRRERKIGKAALDRVKDLLQRLES